MQQHTKFFMSEALALITNETQIYIQLLDEGTRVFRPTNALILEGGRFRVLPTPNYNPNNENWEFPPGTVVICETVTKQGKTFLYATHLA